MHSHHIEHKFGEMLPTVVEIEPHIWLGIVCTMWAILLPWHLLFSENGNFIDSLVRCMGEWRCSS
jgi:hypothetical protein